MLEVAGGSALQVEVRELNQASRLRPGGRSDALDILLRGKTATVVAVEQDYEGRVHLAVTLDDDPGEDLGRQGRPGHRFFFHPEEVEPLTEGEAS